MSILSSISIDSIMPSNPLQAFIVVKVGKKKRKKKKLGATKAIKDRRYTYITMFNQLHNMELSMGEDLISKGQLKGLRIDWVKATHIKLAIASSSISQVEKKALMTLMPPFNLGFWHIYKNKLRIFKTVKMILKLTS